MGSLFPQIGPTQTPPSGYLEFWNGLNRDVSKYEYYRAHQLKILEQYEEATKTHRDIAICLPTGTGKTVIGLSLARMAQIRRKRLVLYLSPHTLLASQILVEAEGLGIPAVPLYGTWPEVEDDAKDQYFAGEAIGVGTYSTLFNSSPKIGRAELIVLDDVHAAAEFVLNPWVVTIAQKKDPHVFRELVELFREQLPAAQFATLGPNPPSDRGVEMVRARDWLLVADTVGAILDRHSSTSLWKFGWTGVRDKLANCFCFVSSEAITIRPWVPPTFQLPEFASAKLRVYLSATLDRWGNIEHIMGIEPIHRLTLSAVPIPGRRLILNLNRLLPNIDDQGRVLHMARATEKALVLCKSLPDRDRILGALKAANYDGALLGSGTIEQDVEKFRNAKKAVLVLANRYDGLDLGDEMCRNIILWKLPLAIGDQEEFETYTWRLVDSAESRARQRVQQGMGRCTRRDADAVVVGLVGEDLVQFILLPRVQAAMPQRLRAELGLCAKLTSPSQLNDLIAACVGRTKEWKSVGAQVDNSASTLPEETYPDEQAMEIHRREATFNRLLWTRNYGGASGSAQGAAQQLVKLQSESAAAPWFYLASVAEDLLQYEASGNPYSGEGARLLGEAGSRQDGRTWFGELASYVEVPTVAHVHEAQVTGVENFLKKYPKQTTKLDDALNEAITNLGKSEAEPFRRGLRVLGESLGLESQTPGRQGAADAIWSLGERAIIIFEAKTEKLPDSALSVNEVRQVVALPREARDNEHVTLEDSFQATCVTDCKKIAREVSQDVNRFSITRPKDVHQFAQRWFNRISLLHKRSELGTQESKLQIQAALKQLRAAHGGLPSAVGIKPAKTELSVVP